MEPTFSKLYVSVLEVLDWVGLSFMPMVCGESQVLSESFKVSIHYSKDVVTIHDDADAVYLVMREEIETGMRLLGVTSLDQLTPDHVRYLSRK